MNKNRKTTDNIVLHDIFDIRGGGERLALSITDCLNADLGYGKHSVNSFKIPSNQQNKIYDLDLKIEFPGLKTWALSRLFTNKTHFLKDYKNVVYSGIISPLAINNHTNGGNYFYCHTPPRFIYDKFDYYLQQYSLPKQVMMKCLISWFKPQYEASVAQMDVIMTNSKYVQTRIKKYLNHDSVVVYPPCAVKKYCYQPHQGYYLSTARLDSLKRIDKIITAFKTMRDKKLVICSSGAEENELRKLAQGYENINFTGQVSDHKFNQLMAQSIATIYIPKDEDFGMSPVESMASGKPVICSGHGGPTESVINGETGCYITDENIVESIISCVNLLDANKAASMQSACEKRADKFSEINFQKNINRLILG